jgi:hypothetical protein
VSELSDALADLAPLIRFEPGRGLRLQDGPDELWAQPGEDAVRALRDLIYARYFCRWSPSVSGPSRYSDRASGEPAFVAALSAASRGACYWEPGWNMVKSEGEWAFVSNGKICLFVEDRRQLDPPDTRDGHPVHVKLPCARENLSPGFFYLMGRAGPIEHRSPHVKVYLNLASEAAPPLIEALLTRSGMEKLRFEGKFVNDPTGYCRVDTALLYVEPQSYPGLVTLLLNLKKVHGDWFRDGTPLFTKELSRGLAVAESPRGEVLPVESFGQHRCRLVAEALVEALVAGEPPGEAWLKRVAGQFAKEGLSIDRPYVKELKARRTKKGVSFQLRPR